MEGRPPRDARPRLPADRLGPAGSEPGARRPRRGRQRRRVAVRRPLRPRSDRRPRELVTMPFVSNDRLDPERSHGDLLLSIEAEHPDTALFALRQLMRRTRQHAGAALGARRLHPPRQHRRPLHRLAAQPDGLHRRHRQPRRRAPARPWTATSGWPRATASRPGRSAAPTTWCGVIRMLVEFWDRTPLSPSRRHIMGRHKVSGAPLGMEHETDVPDYAADPKGDAIPLDAHIRLANPRTPETADSLILRRGFSYARGYDRAGRLDQGLAFVCYQRSLESGLHRRAGAPERRAARGVHPPRGRRLLLRPPGRRARVVPRRGAGRLARAAQADGAHRGEHGARPGRHRPHPRQGRRRGLR